MAEIPSQGTKAFARSLQGLTPLDAESLLDQQLPESCQRQGPRDWAFCVQLLLFAGAGASGVERVNLCL